MENYFDIVVDFIKDNVEEKKQADRVFDTMINWLEKKD